jgi:hypothetical protein
MKGYMGGGLAGINFIEEPPFNAAYTDRTRALTQERAAELQADRARFEMDEARRNREEAMSTDRALRDVVRARTSPTAPVPSSSAPAMPPVGPEAGAAAPPPVPIAPPTVAPAPQVAPQATSLASQTAGRLAQVRGGGAKAFTLLEAQQKQQDYHEEMAIKALGTGDLETFRFYQAKSGLKLPPEVLQSAEARANFARAMDIAKTNYRDDPAQGQAFAQTFMATPGDFQAKLTAGAAKAGPPRSKPNWTATTVVQNGQQVLAFYDSNSRGMPDVHATGMVKEPAAAWTPAYTTGPDGRAMISGFNTLTGEVKEGSVQAAPRPASGAGARSSAWTQQFLSRKTANPGMSDAEIIAQMDTGKAPHEKALWQKAVMEAARQQDVMGKPVNDTPEKLQAAAERIVNAYIQGTGAAAAVSAKPAPSRAAVLPAVGAGRTTQRGPDGRDYPTVSSQAEYDALPPGATYFHAGKGKFLKKG